MNEHPTDSPIDPPPDLFREKIERLLLRHEESRRTVALLQEQVSQLTSERDSLQSRLQVASQRIESVLQRLPAATMPETPMLEEMDT
jgi:cell division septum initiation protein DivIVA